MANCSHQQNSMYDAGILPFLNSLLGCSTLYSEFHQQHTCIFFFTFMLLLVSELIILRHVNKVRSIFLSKKILAFIGIFNTSKQKQGTNIIYIHKEM